MLGPIALAESVSLSGDASGTTSRTYYFDIPFAGTAKRIFIEYALSFLTGSGTVDFAIEDSVSGRVWDDTTQTWSQVTAAGQKVLRTDKEFATRARLRDTVGGTGTTQKVAVLSIMAPGKPF